MNLTKIVTIENNHPVTTSTKVADAFNKRHDNVVRKLESLECSEKFSRLNFEVAEYLDNQGKQRKSYTMTKDGFMFLVMGFTGKKAATIKEAFIAKFNEMEAKLRTKEKGNYLNYLGYQPLTPGQKCHINDLVRTKVQSDETVTFKGVYTAMHKKFNVSKSYDEIPADKYPEVCRMLGAEPLEGELIQHKKFNYPLEKSPLSNEVCQMKEWPLVCLDDLDKNKRPQLLPQLLEELKKGNYDIVGAFIEMQALYASRDRLAKMVQAAKQIHDILQDAVFDGRRGERVSLGHST